jgi:hypothetical protein
LLSPGKREKAGTGANEDYYADKLDGSFYEGRGAGYVGVS